ncbi:DUF2232 domain-containing protein [Falsochrobactrum shanghaiense]|uniref:DUF2232 domain-containing protein n=1 Tax=Falsochrobactrum shanghaiense TaxID=2201899 RepID=A0A316JIM4_9HYPH|nr:DUF2232 domain-containing protein [Falsochrobactrum shanghaiense]PWL19113.1 DUF2232 domain-containing protein [Falsochrobactrum shanghaiense]
MKFNGAIIGVGMVAGLASALMSSGVITQSGLAMVLYFLTPLPIFAAALGWGSGAGILAAAIATIAVGIFAVPMAALLMALTSFIPAATGAYLSGLARPARELGGPTDVMVWYPVSDIVFRLALMVAISFVIIGAIIGFGPDMVGELASALIDRISEADPQFAPDESMRQSLTALLMVALPAIQPATCLVILVGNFYLALRLSAMSGRLRRPRDDWPATLRMPRQALLVFAVALALAFLPGTAGVVATVFAGALSAGFIMAGLAIFHQRTRGKPWRAMALWFVYAAILFFAFLLFFFLVFGLFDTSRGAPVSKIPEADNQ